MSYERDLLLGLRPIPPLYLIKVLSFFFLAVMQGVLSCLTGLMEYGIGYFRKRKKDKDTDSLGDKSHSSIYACQKVFKIKRQGVECISPY